jgi:glycosyltransferase involved in cell wall biosynthesis
VSVSYAVVTPLHDEAENLPRLAECMHAQTVRPQVWLLVENGSTDATPELARDLAEQHPYIRLVTAGSIPGTERGTPIVHALHRGLRELEPFPEAVGQLDADLSFSDSYFEELLRELERDPGLGIISGTCFERSRGEWRERFSTGASAWGAARVYRRACLEQILPLEPRTGWDAIDVAQANALGWRTGTFRHLPFYHHRREAAREQSRWSAWAAQGRVSYFLGYRPTYLVLRSLFRAVRDPAALGLIGGYASDTVRRRPRCTRPGVCDWVRRQQRLRSLARRAAEARGTAGQSAAFRGPGSLGRERGRAERRHDEEHESHLDERERVVREHADGECRDRRR